MLFINFVYTLIKGPAFLKHLLDMCADYLLALLNVMSQHCQLRPACARMENLIRAWDVKVCSYGQGMHKACKLQIEHWVDHVFVAVV